jgi:hypothetical protein
MGELENWRVRAVWVRKIGVKVKRVVIGFEVEGVVARRAKALLAEVVVRVRRGVDVVAWRWMSVRRARRASGDIN